MPVETSLQNVTTGTIPTRTMPPPPQQQQQQQQKPHSPGKEEPRNWIKRYRTEVAASSASVLSTITAFPLDSVKTRMQTYPYDGALHCVKTTYNAEGMRGFFRGASSLTHKRKYKTNTKSKIQPPYLRAPLTQVTGF